jgi:hypothetical protein
MKPIIKTTEEDIQLSVIHNITKTVREKISDPDGREQFIQKEKLVKELPIRKWFRKEGLTSVEQYVTKKNTIARNRSWVYDRYSNRYYPTFHSPDEVFDHLSKRNQRQFENQIGFRN